MDSNNNEAMEELEKMLRDYQAYDPIMQEILRDESLRRMGQMYGGRGMAQSGALGGQASDIWMDAATLMGQEQMQHRQQQVENMQNAASMIFEDNWHRMNDDLQRDLSEFMADVEMEWKNFDRETQNLMAEFLFKTQKYMSNLEHDQAVELLDMQLQNALAMQDKDIAYKEWYATMQDTLARDLQQGDIDAAMAKMQLAHDLGMEEKKYDAMLAIVMEFDMDIDDSLQAAGLSPDDPLYIQLSDHYSDLRAAARDNPEIAEVLRDTKLTWEEQNAFFHYVAEQGGDLKTISPEALKRYLSEFRAGQ